MRFGFSALLFAGVLSIAAAAGTTSAVKPILMFPRASTHHHFPTEVARDHLLNRHTPTLSMQSTRGVADYLRDHLGGYVANVLSRGGQLSYLTTDGQVYSKNEQTRVLQAAIEKIFGKWNGNLKKSDFELTYLPFGHGGHGGVGPTILAKVKDTGTSGHSKAHEIAMPLSSGTAIPTVVTKHLNANDENLGTLYVVPGQYVYGSTGTDKHMVAGTTTATPHWTATAKDIATLANSGGAGLSTADLLAQSGVPTAMLQEGEWGHMLVGNKQVNKKYGALSNETKKTWKPVLANDFPSALRQLLEASPDQLNQLGNYPQARTILVR